VAEPYKLLPLGNTWKEIDAKQTYENIKIEIVDIWHFVMMRLLESKS